MKSDWSSLPLFRIRPNDYRSLCVLEVVSTHELLGDIDDATSYPSGLVTSPLRYELLLNDINMTLVLLPKDWIVISTKYSEGSVGISDGLIPSLPGHFDFFTVLPMNQPIKRIHCL